MDQKQIDWMRDLAGKGPAIYASAQTQNRKDQLLLDVYSALDAKVEEIRLGEDFAIEMKSSPLAGFLRRTFRAAPKKKQAISETGDQDEEFDTGHDLADSMGLTPEQATSLTRAHGLIVEQVAYLRKQRDDATNKPLFTDVEISKEVFEPLMRRKIIPENAISDRYSDVSRTFASASSQYDLRLAAYAESVGSNDKVAAKLGVSSDALKSAGNAATGLMGMLTAVVPSMKDFPLGEATDICTACTTTLTSPLDIAAAVLKENGLTPKSVESICKSAVGAVTGWITAGFDIKFDGGTDQDSINQQLGKAIVSGFKMGLSSITFCTKLAQGGDKVQEAFDELASIVEQCCVCAGVGGAYRNNVKDDGALSATGQHIKDALLQSKELLVILTAAEQDDPTGTVTKALQRMLKDAIEDGAKTYALERQNEIKADIKAKEEQEDSGITATDPTEISNEKAQHKQEATDKSTFESNFGKPTDTANIAIGMAAVSPDGIDVTTAMKLAQTLNKEQLADLFKNDPQLKSNKKLQELMTKIAAKRDQELEAAGKTVDDEVAKDEQVFRALLSGSEAMESDADVEKIELLILQIKKDQMIVKLAEGFLKAGPAAVAAFLPPASIAADAVGLVIAARKAYKHFEAWSEWSDNVTDAKSAMSVQVAAMANRAGLSHTQGVRNSMVALENLIKLVGDSLGTAGGPFAPIGVAIAKGTSAVSSIKDIIIKIYDEAQLKRNWEKYKTALDNPGDRKAIRSAIRGNPTLAKYVIAYGGAVARDPVAKNALRKCGLSAKVLESPNTNEQKVVAYLEALYADDPVILEKPEDAPKWHPGPALLEAASIGAFSHAAQTSASPRLAEPIPQAVIRDTLQMEADKEELDRARKAWNDAVKATPHDQAAEDKALMSFVRDLKYYSTALGEVFGSLSGWKPVGTDQKLHKEALAYRAGLIRQVTMQKKRIDREIGMYDEGEL